MRKVLILNALQSLRNRYKDTDYPSAGSTGNKNFCGCADRADGTQPQIDAAETIIEGIFLPFS
jgi:hypothetical protein